MLDLLDAECTLVSDGEAAVAKASQRAFDAILMDVEMPKLDGVQAALEVRRANQHIPIIALTAHATSTDRERCEAAGMNGYLTKPVRIDSLRAELLRHVAPPSRPDDASIL
jgi:CheY-like chemotaxis protein